MKVFYEEPNDGTFYYKWTDSDSGQTVWYKNTTDIYSYDKAEGLPSELVAFLDKWTDNIAEYKKTFREPYPVKLARIQFIYKDIIYRIYPSTVGATYETDFMSDHFYEVPWDSLFEAYQREIRDDMKDTLGIAFSSYTGFLD
ncbi:MAG: hypothetical protein IKD45_02295 [Clostridia bacterium]|nr:hypothetical protein [Clostridia bacterium]